MEIDQAYFKERKNKARAFFDAQREIYCPYFQANIILNSDGFHHLQFSARREREKKAQLLKFSLLPLALDIIRKTGTIQEYRKILTPIGKPSMRDGSIPMKEVEYWGLVAIVREQNVKVRVILRRIGTGNVTFWSVMPDVKFKNGKQKLASGGIEDN
jgi:hypothetical protein